MSVVKTPPAKPAKPAQAAPAAPPAPEPAAPEPAAPAAKPEVPAATPGGEEDFLMGPVAPAPPAPEPAAGQEPAAPEPPATGPLKAPELRAEYAKVKKRVADLEKELTDLKAKPGEAKALDEPERKAFVEQITTLKKQLEDTSAALKTVAYEQSDEYKAKYERPFIDAWQEGVQLVTGLTVTDQEGNTRKGTDADFQAIMREPDNEQAANLAQEMFGANAFYVLAQRRDIQRLHTQRVKALDEYRHTFSEREKLHAETSKKEQEEREARRVQNTTLFKRFNAEAAQKYPQYFAPIDGDEEGNQILDKGFQYADLAFSGAPDLPNERRVQLHSAIRNRAAAFGRLVHQLKAKDSQIEALQKELEEIRGSTPGGGQVGREAAGPKVLTADEEIELAASKYR